MNAFDNHRALLPLIGLPLRRMGRAADLFWLHFGELREVPTHDGSTKCVGEWAIHVQCPWRFSRIGLIIVAKGDFYRSPEGDALGKDWDVLGKSKFDQVAEALCRESEVHPSTVVSVDCDEKGGFSMHFDDEIKLEAFPEGSVGQEQWRRFQPGIQNPHFVASV